MRDWLAKRPSYPSAAYAILAVGLSFMVYAPILKNYFWMDDFLIFEMVTNWPLAKFLNVNWAGHLVLVRNAFYAGMYAVVGANPMPYYLVLLVLHGLNVALVFATVRTVTRSAELACLAAAAWGTCPVNEGALGWLAASGNVVVGTTTLIVLYDAVRTLWRQTRVRLARAVLWAALLSAGAQSFGTGLGVAIAAPVMLMWLMDRLTWPGRAVLLCVPVVTVWMYGQDYGQFTGSLASSTLAQANMLFHLQAIGFTDLIRGLGYEPGPADFLAPVDFNSVPLSLASFAVYLIAALVISLWASAVWLSTGRQRRLLVTLAVLALSNYGVIAVGRGYWIESLRQSAIRWAAQARYHYSGTALLAIGLAVVAATLFSQRLVVWARTALAAWLIVFAFLYANTGWRIRHYDAERQRAERVLSRIDSAIRSTPAGEPVITYNEPFPDGPFTAGAASLYVMNRSNRYTPDREVYFVDRYAAAVWDKYPASPLAHVLLPPPYSGLVCTARLPLQSESPTSQRQPLG